MTNLVNTNITGTNFQVLTLEISGETDQDINLNDVWDQLLSLNNEGELIIDGLTYTVSTTNTAVIENNISTSANTGGNTSTSISGNSQIHTGDAIAISNVTNVANTNIVGSNFLYSQINITAPSNANIILPSKEKLGSLSSYNFNPQDISTSLVSENTASVVNNVSSSANSGNNIQQTSSGENSIQTGTADSRSHVYNFVNTTINENWWFSLVINHYGNWTGNIYAWENPEAQLTPPPSTTILQSSGESTMENTSASNTNFAPSASLQNSATVINNVTTTANTGDNSQKTKTGSNEIKTGDALAISNVFNVVNTNIVGSYWFSGNINVLREWSGNLIFAYPDVSVSLSGDGQQVYAGDNLNYQIIYSNTGYDKAENVILSVRLPAESEIISSSIPANCQNLICRWQIGNLTPNQSGSISFSLKIADGFHFNTLTTWLDSFIPTAHAYSAMSNQIQVTAEISSSNPEYSTSNNQASAKALVHERPPVEDTSATDQRQPKIDISAANNVNSFVYPGDTVTFEISAQNNSDVSCYSSYIIHNLYNNHGEQLSSNRLNIGEFKAGKKAKINFGLQTPRQAPADTYLTQTIIICTAPNGNEIQSNTAKTTFNIKLASLLIIPVAKAEEVSVPQVLGTSDTSPQPTCDDDKSEDYRLYLIVFALSLWLSLDRLKKLWITVK